MDVIKEPIDRTCVLPIERGVHNRGGGLTKDRIYHFLSNNGNFNIRYTIYLVGRLIIIPRLMVGFNRIDLVELYTPLYGYNHASSRRAYALTNIIITRGRTNTHFV